MGGNHFDPPVACMVNPGIAANLPFVPAYAVTQGVRPCIMLASSWRFEGCMHSFLGFLLPVTGGRCWLW